VKSVLIHFYLNPIGMVDNGIALCGGCFTHLCHFHLVDNWNRNFSFQVTDCIYKSLSVGTLLSSMNMLSSYV
jgi:hypothetical protein